MLSRSLSPIRLATLAAAAVAAAAAAQIARPWLPRPALTPGASFPRLTAATVCSRGYARRARNVSTVTRRRVWRAYALQEDRKRYELDHLVPIGIGGDNSSSNLWPQPYDPPPPGRGLGARTKDRLEARLRKLVCSGRLPLADAQREIATDWVASYRARVR